MKRNKSQLLTRIPICNLDIPDYHNMLAQTGVPPKEAIATCIEALDDENESYGIVLPKFKQNETRQ